MYIINTIPHGKWFVRYLRTRCFCIRNLSRSLRSLVRFLIRQELVRKYRTPALSMKYSLFSRLFGWLKKGPMVFGLHIRQCWWRMGSLANTFERCSWPARAPKEKVDSGRPVAMDIPWFAAWNFAPKQIIQAPQAESYIYFLGWLYAAT